MNPGRVIWKHHVDVTDTVMITVPGGSRVRHVAADGPTRLWVWTEGHPSARTEDDLTLHVVGTGNPVPAEARGFIITVMAHPFVWHVYEGERTTREAER